MQFGSQVHELMERVSWLDETSPALPDDPAGRAVAALLRSPDLHPVFHRDGRHTDLLREQAIDSILDDQFLSGVIDRLHLHRDPSGKVRHVEIIDYKTDAVADPAELALAYTGQMNAYRAAVQKIHPHATIDCFLLSVRHATMVTVAPGGITPDLLRPTIEGPQSS